MVDVACSNGACALGVHTCLPSQRFFAYFSAPLFELLLPIVFLMFPESLKAIWKYHYAFLAHSVFDCARTSHTQVCLYTCTPYVLMHAIHRTHRLNCMPSTFVSTSKYAFCHKVTSRFEIYASVFRIHAPKKCRKLEHLVYRKLTQLFIISKEIYIRV